jgi:hypothetical protein
MANSKKSKKQKPEHPKLQKITVIDGLNNKITINSPGKFQQESGKQITMNISGSRFFNKDKVDNKSLKSSKSSYFDTFEDIFSK